ncbi:hypothetical protein [Streptomyces sp. NRRL S-350]|uniref:hypothetical protein n=1 Tax=Streptomyces sp. NRRL S-350 TaxID=1463902 RepID=UPI0004BE9D81|nr:hypothetical protein [Streptomyces sp. NRRL S-350]
MNPNRPAPEHPLPSGEDIHTYFGLSYADSLVLRRAFLEAMPPGWQALFVQLLREYDEAFAHLPQPEVYKVTAATEHIVGELGDTQLAAAGITCDRYGGLTPPTDLDPEELDAWEDEHRLPEGVYHQDGVELDPHSRVLLPAADPVPHYRTSPRPTPQTPELDPLLLDEAHRLLAYEDLARANSALTAASSALGARLVQGVPAGTVRNLLDLACATAAAGLQLEGTDYPRAHVLAQLATGMEAQR